MKPYIFCQRCGWIDKRRKGRYVLHRVRCGKSHSRRSTLLMCAVLLVLLEAGLLSSNAIGFFGRTVEQPLDNATSAISAAVAVREASVTPAVQRPDPGIKTVDALLKKFQVNNGRRERLADAVIRSSRKHNVDPRLVASVLIVESRGNPFAISRSDAVGIMQIHVPTWKNVIEQEGINLFKIEDNVDFGARILSAYVGRYGRNEGIMRYNGLYPDNPASVENAEKYLQRVEHVYVTLL
jgi:soluble lytic murein transglycosylase-like protein